MSLRPLNVALIGGGGGAFIVQPHQRAIFFDGTRRVTTAALHPNPEVAMQEAAAWPYPIQGYRSYDELIATEAKKPLGERVDYALIVTPNHVHFDPAMKCIKAGIPVFCEKPLTVTLEEADQLVAAVKAAKVPFGVAHTYLGHWTTRFARFIVTSGLIGEVRWVGCLLHPGLAGRAHRGPRGDAGRMARRSQEGRRQLLRRRHRHTRPDAPAVHHRTERDQTPGAPRDVRRTPPVGRPFHDLLPAEQRRSGPGPRFADRDRPQERSGHRSQRQQGQSVVAAGVSRKKCGSCCPTNRNACTIAAPCPPTTGSSATCRPT